MPAQIRTKFMQKIVWSILPKPANLTQKKTEKEREIDQKLNMAWIARQR